MDVIHKSQMEDMVKWGKFLHPRKICEISDIFVSSCVIMQKKFSLLIFCKGTSKKKFGTILMLCLNVFEIHCFEFYLNAVSLISLH